LLGVTLSLVSRAFGFDPDMARTIGAILLLMFGSLLLITPAQEMFSRIMAPLATKAGGVITAKASLWGNFMTGTLLGAVWSPCSGPTLGTAVGLATKAETAPRGFLLMLVFSLAASLPLLAIAYGARTTFMAHRARLAAFSTKAKPILGIILVVVSASILLGWDKQAEAVAVKRLPSGWIDLMSKF
jgi:cytochrome c biogenesis protein CcdA